LRNTPQPQPGPDVPPVPARDTTTYFTPCTRYLAGSGATDAQRVAGLETFAQCSSGGGLGIDFTKVGFGSPNQYQLGLSGSYNLFHRRTHHGAVRRGNRGTSLRGRRSHGTARAAPARRCVGVLRRGARRSACRHRGLVAHADRRGAASDHARPTGRQSVGVRSAASASHARQSDPTAASGKDVAQPRVPAPQAAAQLALHRLARADGWNRGRRGGGERPCDCCLE
jgi:hypothetical protein